MDCRRIRDLILRDMEGALTEAEQARLQAHLDSCPACRQWQEDQLSAAVALDSQAAGGEFELSESFTGRLHLALIEEQQRQSQQPAERIRRWLASLAATRPVLARRPLRLAIAGLLACVILLAAAAFLQAPLPEAVEVPIGHLASFSVQTTPDGRVYARVTTRTTDARSSIMETRP